MKHPSWLQANLKRTIPIRPRRNRQNAWVRAAVRENTVSADHLVQPLFIHDVSGDDPIPSMPGCSRLSIDGMLREVEQGMKHGVGGFALFPKIPEELKDPHALEVGNENGFLPRALKRLKKEFPEANVFTDVALDPYSSSGHDGVVNPETGEVMNDLSVTILVRQALVQAQAGATWISPSDMMDGRVGAIRTALDDEGFTNVGIMSYCSKYASSFYGPFRDALGSAPKAGDKKTYQMDFGNSKEALRELALDEAEGADMVMVKPGMPFLDVIHLMSQHTNLPISAYHVSGEYAMLKAAAEKGWLDEKKCALEALTAFRRAGANFVFTYYATQAAKWMTEL